VTNREKTTQRLISGVNCVAESAYEEFTATKLQFHKTGGRAYYHIVQAFAPDDPLDFDTAHELGIKLAEHFPGYQCLVATHMNTAHIHNHIIMNSVSFEDGRKFHQSAQEMRQVKEFVNDLCREYGLSVTESKADPKRIPDWKHDLRYAIREAMSCTSTREEFISHMEELGYKVDWKPDHKYMTYTTPSGIKCRDSKLFDETLSRDSLECYYKLGGVKYLSAAQESAQMNNEPTPMLRDVLIGMGAVSLALMSLASDEERRDEDFFQQVYYAMLAADDIFELIRMLREQRDREQRTREQAFDYSVRKKPDDVDQDDSKDDDLPTPQAAEPVIPKYYEDEDDDEDYDEEYARNHGEDDYDEDEQGWGMDMGM
jgi:hypothetical protein